MKPAAMTLFKQKPVRAKSVDREGLEQAALMAELREIGRASCRERVL